MGCAPILPERALAWDRRRVLASPSPSVRFKPHRTSFTIDALAPGWRWLTLMPDGTLETAVCRLDTTEFLPDLESEGY